MKKIILLLLSVMTIGNISYASFPVSENNIQTEVVDNQLNEGQKLLLPATDFNIGGFLLGFLLGLIGVGLAYIFSDDPSFRRSAWQGLGAFVILILILSMGTY